jgi:hypothetical protein
MEPNPMGSTPLNQSDNTPREDTDPAAAATESSDGTAGPIYVDEPEATPIDETADALAKTESDTQELSREEVVALISTDDEVREDAGETVRSDPTTDQKTAEPQETQDLAAEGETDSETGAPHAAASAEPGAPTRSNDLFRVGLWGTGLAVLILLSAAFGFSYLINRPPAKSIGKKQPAANAHLKTSPESDSRAAADSVPKVLPNIQSPADSLLLRLNAKQDQMDALRDQMLSKADEIENLRNHYRKSIRRVEAAVLMEKRYGGIHSLQQALETKRIALELETIRRRQAYIDCLAKPADWLLQGSEELLFLKRKHVLQSLIFPVSSQIDPEKLAAEKEAAFDRYSNSVEVLEVDLQKASYQPVEQIWQNLLEQEKQFASNRFPAPPDTQQGSGGGLQVNNQSIWLEICRGRYNRKSELTALSAEAADCLAGWKEPDLFLNGIKELSPETARRLFKWKGSWFCLNGLTDLPRETAEYLFQWKGDWLSLNGVTHLSFESSIFLTGWKGRTLELMGLSPESMESEALALRHLAQWQRSGGKLFVPEGIRRLLGDSASSLP